MSTYIFRFDIFSFLSFCPCFQSRQKKEGAIPAVFLVRPWKALQDTTEEDTPQGRILHVAGSCIEAFQVSPEAERCVERKVSNCLLRIIAKLQPFVGVSLQKFAKGKSRLRAFFRGKGRPVLYPILPPRGEISRGK